jgi:addiction module HigA family antidote
MNIKREPTHPCEILREDFMKPLALTQVDLAKNLCVSFRTISELVNEKRAVSPEMALRLGKYFRTSAELWLSLQNTYDLYKAAKKADKALQHINPVAA